MTMSAYFVMFVIFMRRLGMVLLNDTRLIPEVVTGSEKDRSRLQRVSDREIPFLILIACSKAGPDIESEMRAMANALATLRD
jgi:ABC-type thiamine transport system ATPase subunit